MTPISRDNLSPIQKSQERISVPHQKGQEMPHRTMEFQRIKSCPELLTFIFYKVIIPVDS